MAKAATRTSASGSEAWQYQLRLNLTDEFAEAARSGIVVAGLAPLAAILRRHDASLHCQFDAFADYCAEAERNGIERYPLYRWTRATVENPSKKAKYLKSFAIHVGGKEIYDKDHADALEAELRPLVGAGAVASMARHDTNPANNPQPPRKYRP